MTKRERKTSRIPEFSSYEEEAKFWDTHDTTDFEEEFKPVRVRVAKKLSEPIAVRLDTETLKVLRERARQLGIGPTTLIRMWVLERLREENKSTTQGVQQHTP